MKKYLLLLLVSGLATQVMGEEVDLGSSVITPDYIEIQKLSATKNVIVIGKDDIDEKGYQSVEQVLKDVPGVTVGTSDIGGSIDIRGQGAGEAQKNIQVLIDGAPITNLVNHPMQGNYNVVPIEQVEKIEIIPGGGSVLYGNGTSGGVINITTNLKAMAKPVNKVGVEFSQDLEQKKYINLGTKINDDLTLQLNYSKSHKEWFFKHTYDDIQYFSTGLNYKISNDQNISLQYSHLEQDGRFVKSIKKTELQKYGKNAKPSLRSIYVLDEHGVKKKVKKRGYIPTDRKSDNFKLSYNYRINDTFLVQIDGFKNKGYFKGDVDETKKMDQNTYGTRSKLNISYGDDSSLLLGFDYLDQKAIFRHSKFKLNRDKNGKFIKYNKKLTWKKEPVDFVYHKKTKAAYLLNLYKYNNFEFTQGIRYDITDWNYEKGDKEKSEETRVSINKNYELSAGYNYRDTGKIYARYERGFTGPNGIEVSETIEDKDGNLHYIATEAKDEIFDIYEVGIRDYIFGSAVSLTGFYTKTDNQMDRIFVNYLGRTVNYLKTERYGIEASAIQTIGDFTFEESYAYLEGKTRYNSAGEKAIKEDRKINWGDCGLFKVPKHSVTLKADYAITDNLTIGGSWVYTGKYDNFFDQNEVDAGSVVNGHTVVNVRASYNNPNGVSIYGGINNICNEHYYSFANADDAGVVVPEKDRTIFVGASYTF